MKPNLRLFQSVSSLFALLLFLGCKHEEADVAVTSIEITQGIQNANNTIPLIADRSTAVRVYLSTDATSDVGPVTGRLIVTVDGREITPAGGLLQQSVGDAQPNPNRDVESHTVNFELPAPTGITQSSNVDFEVTIDYVKDTDPSNNTLRIDNLNFISLDNPKLLFARVNYLPAGLGLPALSTVEAGIGDAMVHGIYPVVDSDPNLYEPAFPATFPFNYDLDGDNLIDSTTEASVLLSTLDIFKDLMVVFGTHPLSYTFIYGWLNGSPMDGFAGIAPVGGNSAFGNTTLTQYQRSYAHELGHNFGLGHAPGVVAPDTGWDTGARLENNPTTNNTSGRVKSSTLVDIMNAGPPTNSTWVNTLSYSFVYTRMLLETVLTPPLAATIGTKATAPQDKNKSIDASGALIVQGAFNGAGTQLLLYPTLRLTTPARLRSVPENGIFIAVVTTDEGEPQRIPFDAKVCYEDGSPEKHGYFELQIPLEPYSKIKSLEIYNTEKMRKMGALVASKPPLVKIISPDQGSQLKEKVTVRWTAKDTDTPADRLVYHLAYSPDSGKNWVAVAVNLHENAYTFPASQLPPAENGKGILKLYVCEGLNTVTDQIVNLSIQNAN